MNVRRYGRTYEPTDIWTGLFGHHSEKIDDLINKEYTQEFTMNQFWCSEDGQSGISSSSSSSSSSSTALSRSRTIGSSVCMSECRILQMSPDERPDVGRDGRITHAPRRSTDFPSGRAETALTFGVQVSNRETYERRTTLRYNWRLSAPKDAATLTEFHNCMALLG